jgi:uncharacterized paraquat-inducible protein A
MEIGLKQIISGLVKNPSKIVDIAEAWIIAKNPSIEQKNLAEARWNICIQCDEFRKERPVTGEPYCNDCGCPLNKKIFTNKFNECPLEKWKDVDNLLFHLTQKQKKSII